MRQCDSCGAKNIVRGEWQGGDPQCEHFFINVIPSSMLEQEIKLLMTQYSPIEIRRVVELLGGGV